MTSDMREGDTARISYGDPETILREVANGIRRLNRFAPEVIKLYSCGARRTFWGPEVSRETAPFQYLAPTSGFFTSGEFLRTNGHLNQHNVTLVVGALREGDAPEDRKPLSMEDAGMSFSGRVSMVNRLATFIQAATEELEAANRSLSLMAISDGMTRLFNRMEIQRRISAQVEEQAEPISLHEKSAEVCAKLETVMLSGRGQGMLDNEMLSTAGGGVVPPEPSHRKTNARWYMPAAGTVTTSLRLCQSDCRLSLLPPSSAIHVAGRDVVLSPEGRTVPAVSVSESGTRATRK